MSEESNSAENTTKKQRKIGKGSPPEGWQPGQSGNPNGRPKKIFSQFKDQGYKLAQINDTYMAMLGLTEKELQAIKDSEGEKGKEYTALEKVIAASLLRSMKDGKIGEVETLITRTHGSPTQSVEHNIKTEQPLFSDDIPEPTQETEQPE